MDCSFQDIEFPLGEAFFFCNHISLHCCLWRFLASFIVFLFCFPSFLVCLFYSSFHHFLLFFASFIAFLLCAKSPYFVCRFLANSQVPSFFFVCKIDLVYGFFWGACELFLLCMKLLRFRFIYCLLCVWFFLKLLI